MNDFKAEFLVVWKEMPHKRAFALLFVGLFLLFHFLGNSTFGYVDTPSLFAWLNYDYGNSADDEHGYLIPFVVIVLAWWKRKELMAVPKRPWWPAALLVALGLLIHIFGFVIQQTRVSVIGFFAALYGLMGMVWGPGWMRAILFPYFLFAFCVPLGTVSVS